MARYTAGECYAYAGRQTDLIRAARQSISNQYEMLLFLNAVKKKEMDGDIDEIENEMQRCIQTLNNAWFSPTNF